MTTNEPFDRNVFIERARALIPRVRERAAQHVALTWDVQAANYAGVLLGQPSNDPKL